MIRLDGLGMDERLADVVAARIRSQVGSLNQILADIEEKQTNADVLQRDLLKTEQSLCDLRKVIDN